MMADMDIEMDLDIGYAEEELAIPEMDAAPAFEFSVRSRSDPHRAFKTDMYCRPMRMKLRPY